MSTSSSSKQAICLQSLTRDEIITHLTSVKTNRQVLNTLQCLKRSEIRNSLNLDEIISRYWQLIDQNQQDYWGFLGALAWCGRNLCPSNFLYIGEVKGEVIAQVAALHPSVNIYIFDYCVSKESGQSMSHQGFLSDLLKTVGHSGDIHYIEGSGVLDLNNFLVSTQSPPQFHLIFIRGSQAFEQVLSYIFLLMPRLIPNGALILAYSSKSLLQKVGEIIRNSHSDYSYLIGSGTSLMLRTRLKQTRLNAVPYSRIDKSVGEIKDDHYVADSTVHFFTPVINGEPFIRYHINVFTQLPFNWYWHIIEGFADPAGEGNENTLWSGQITDEFHRNGLSNDGTSEYLNEIAQQFQHNIFVYRKIEGELWSSILEMINAPLENINEECLLWRVDNDELWSVDHIKDVCSLFKQHPKKTAAYFYCYYFVGPNKYISSFNTWTTLPNDWIRVWRFKPGMKWSRYKPMVLKNAHGQNVGVLNPFTRDETKKRGISFQHCAYMFESQIRFKQAYYGYEGSTESWKKLQDTRGPVNVRDFLPWAKTDALVNDWPAIKGPLLFDREKLDRQKGDPPELPFCSVDLNSHLAKELYALISTLHPTKIIETGTYKGQGVTSIIWHALQDFNVDADFITIEGDKDHYQKAVSYFKKNNMKIHAEYGLTLPGYMMVSSDDKGNTPEQDNVLFKALEKNNFRPDLVCLHSTGDLSSLEFQYLLNFLESECCILLKESFPVFKTDTRFRILAESTGECKFYIVKYVPVKSILFIRTDSLYENILATSMLQYIHEKYKNSKITAVCQENITEIYKACPFIDDLVGIDKINACKDREYINSLIQRLRALKPDLALNTMYSREQLADVLTTKSGAYEKIAFHGDLYNNSEEIRDKYNRYYTHIISSDNESRLEIEWYRDFLKCLSIEGQSLEPKIWTTIFDEIYADEFFHKNNLEQVDTIALFPNALHNKEIYPYYEEVVKHFKNMTFIILGDRGIHRKAQEIYQQFPDRCYNLAGTTTILQMASIIRKCSLYIGADSSGAHIACAEGVPNIVITGGSHFGRFFPYSPLTSLVCLPLECYGCKLQCKYKTVPCIEGIRPEVVIETINRTLKEKSEKPRVFYQDKSLWEDYSEGPEWKFFDGFINPHNVILIPVDEILLSVNLSKENKKEEERVMDSDLNRKRDELTKALELDPNNALTHHDLGEVYYEMGDGQKAREHFVKAKELDPANRDIILHYSEVLKSLGEYQEAKTILLSHLFTSGYDKKIFRTLALIADSNERKGAGPMLVENEERYLVSAIVSTYDAERFICGRLQNLIDQTLYQKHQLEIIIIDSSSSQNEKSIVGVFRMRYENIVFVRTSERESLYAALNRGIQLSKAKFIINADTDDRFAPDAIERMANELHENPDIHAIYGNWLCTKVQNDTFDSDTEKILQIVPEFFPPLLCYDQITSHAVLLRRSVFRDIGLYDESYKVCGDRDFMLRFSVYGLKAKKLDHIVGLYLDNPEGLKRSERIAWDVENSSLFGRCLSPEYFILLFGKLTLPHHKELAQLYAGIGSLGKSLCSLKGDPFVYAVLAEKLLSRALDFDQTNVMALNNRAIIKCLAGEHAQGIHFFEKAEETADQVKKEEIEKNLSAAQKGSLTVEDYIWFSPDSTNYCMESETLTIESGQDGEMSVNEAQMNNMEPDDDSLSEYSEEDMLTGEYTEIISEEDIAELEAMEQIELGEELADIEDQKEVGSNEEVISKDEQASEDKQAFDMGLEADTSQEVLDQQWALSESMDQAESEHTQCEPREECGEKAPENEEEKYLESEQNFGEGILHEVDAGREVDVRGAAETIQEGEQIAVLGEENLKESEIVSEEDLAELDALNSMEFDEIMFDRSYNMKKKDIVEKGDSEDEEKSEQEESYPAKLCDDALTALGEKVEDLADEKKSEHEESYSAKLCDDALTALGEKVEDLADEKKSEHEESYSAKLCDDALTALGEKVEDLADEEKSEEHAPMDNGQSEMREEKGIFADRSIPQDIECEELRKDEGEPVSPEELYRTRIQPLINEGNHQEAIHAFEKLLELFPDCACAHNDLGTLYFDTGAKQKALSHYQAAAGLEPSNSTFQKNLADFYYVEKGHIEMALKIYLKILQDHPQDTDTLFCLGNVCESLKKFDDAQFFYNRVLALDPLHEGARKNLANLQERTLTISDKEVSQDYLVSAIVSVYNAERFIRGCIEDLEAQTIAEKLEIIIVDSGSQQNEHAIVQEFQKHYANIVYIKTQERESLYKAWNRGIKAARGTYITNANADDRHAKDAFERMAAILEARPDIVLVYAGVIITKTENETFDRCTPIGTYNWYDWDRNDLLDKGCFIGPQPMWRKKVHDLYGYFDEEYSTSGDYEFWLRISQTYDFFYLNRPLGLYLQSPDSIEHKNRSTHVSENMKLLSLYKDAAERGRLVRCMPIDQLQSLKGEGIRKDQGRVEQLVNNIEEFLPLEGQDNDYESRKRALLNHECSKEDIEQFIHRASCLILHNTSWWPERNRKRVSIIVHFSGQDTPHGACLESIKRNTKEPYEVVLVDNMNHLYGGNQTENMHTRVMKSCNEAIKNSSGNYIVLLEADTIVTQEWLSGMIECLESSSDTGIIGPVSNKIKGVQKSLAAYDGSSDLIPVYAKSFRERNRHRRIPSLSIDPSCMLFRRELLEKIGLLDEELKVGGYEYEDLCMRAALEGYENFIAGDVFVYHYEHRNIGENKKLFSEKWTGINAQSPLGEKVLSLNVIRNAKELNHKGELDTALDLLLSGIKQCPDERRIYYTLAEILIESKQYKDAIDILEKMPPHDQELRKLELMGFCKEGLGLYSEADKCAEYILEINPSSALAFNLKGLVAYKEGRGKEAEDFFTRAITSDPGYGEPYTNLGAIKWETKQEKDALNLFLKGFMLSPSVADIIGICHSAVTALEEFGWAEVIFRDANVLNPLNKRIKFLLIDILIKQGKFDKAIEEIEEALTLFPIEEGMLSAALRVRNLLQVPSEIREIARGKPLISLCVIVKNEENNLARCLRSVKPVVDEIIVVDTGSTDKTKAIAEVFGVKVYDFEWSDDFSQARNHALSNAHGKWIFILDADEVISPQDYDKLRKIVQEDHDEPGAYSFVTRNYTMCTNIIGWISNDGAYSDEEAGSGYITSEKVRLFPNNCGIYFVYPVHEVVEPILKEKGIKVGKCPLPIHHYGKLNKEKSDRKGDIYYYIGKKKLDEKESTTLAIRELAIQAGLLEKWDEAIKLWQEFITMHHEIVHDPEAFVNLGTAYWHVGKFDDALDAAKKAMEIAPEMKEAHYNYAICQLSRGNVKEALSLLEKLYQRVPDYLSAQFMLSAAYLCDKNKEKGLELLEKLRHTKLGPGLVHAFNELSRNLILFQRYDYALSILDAAIESNNFNKELLHLFSDVVKAKTQNISV
ncbi:MAG: glycosyltransferase [bacterium]